jgi:hypothetical protein
LPINTSQEDGYRVRGRAVRMMRKSQMRGAMPLQAPDRARQIALTEGARLVVQWPQHLNNRTVLSQAALVAIGPILLQKSARVGSHATIESALPSFRINVANPSLILNQTC